MAFARVWTNSQMQVVTAECPELFSASSKSRKQLSKQYKSLLDNFSNSNFRASHELVAKNPNLLQSISLTKSYEFESGSFDVAIFLDADCTTIAEAMPGIAASKKVILLGNPRNSNAETSRYATAKTNGHTSSPSALTTSTNTSRISCAARTSATPPPAKLH